MNVDIIGDRKYVQIPGDKRHELPPLLVRRSVHFRRLDNIMAKAKGIVDSEEMIPQAMGLPDDPRFEQPKLELAINLVEQYTWLVLHWKWGDDILEWIRQCEITFERWPDLRHLLRGDLWPHAGRSSFVQLLEDKAVPTEGVDMQKAVGLRLTFRQPPPISCFSDQFLFYLKDEIGQNVFKAWASRNPAPVSCLPPERFAVQVLEM